MTDREDQSERIRRQLKSMAAGEDIRGMEIAHSIRVLSRLFDLAVNRSPEFGELSGPRLGILLRLLMEEERGNTAGINPTRLSHFQDVKKNTITSLLRGLEESGLIERTPDPAARRAALVRISPAGRELVRSSAPARFAFMNRVTSSLNDRERDQVLVLLEKLRASMPLHTKPAPSEEG